jgi:hypothetical protein
VNRALIPILAGAAVFYAVRKAKQRSGVLDVDPELLARARPIPDKAARDEERGRRAQRRQKRRGLPT